MTVSALLVFLRERRVALVVLSALALLLGFVPATSIQGRAIGGMALLPPFVAIACVVLTRRLIASLMAGVVVGAVVFHGMRAFVPLGLRDYGWRNLTDTAHLYIVGFTLALLGMVQVTSRAGGAKGIVVGVARWVKSARGTAVGTFVLGLLIFFDDYANCMLVGPTMRPLADRFRMSREKLAYLVDSTAAPVAGLVPISTWVGYETGLLDDAAKALDLGQRGYALLISALPFRFYCLMTLVFLLSNAWLGRDFGPMLRAERRAVVHGKLVADDAKPMADPDASSVAPDDVRPRSVNAALPVLVVTLGTLSGLIVDGGGAPTLRAAPLTFFSFDFWRETLGRSENNVQVLFWAAVAGAVVAMLLPLAQRALSPLETLRAFGRGARTGLYAVLVLVLAWALAAVCKDLGTGPVLVAAIGKSMPAVLVPAITFLIAAAVAFSTGTSWGTMAILIPTALPLAHAAGGELILLLTVTSVLDGAIFGDHCSPISDTTLMSSIASGSDHLHHVGTQLPYAFVVMLAALLGGYVPTALGAPPWLGVGVASLGLLAFLRFVGRSPRQGLEPVPSVELTPR